VLLSGASGFIGAHALDALLERGHEVHAVVRHAGTKRDGVTWHELDLLASDSLTALAKDAQTSHLLHLAWYAVPGRFWTAPENERWIDASLSLLRAFGEAGGRRAVMAGTCAEYLWGADSLSERDTPLEPATLYGACKRATYIAATAVAEELDVSLAWGRIFFLYGPGEDQARLVSGVARELLLGNEVSTTDGLQRRDFMHVRDVAAAFVALLESEVLGPVNIASGEAIQVREIVALVAEQAGGAERVRFGALARRTSEPEVIVADVERLANEVGFRPTIGLERGIVDTVAWWRGRI
jgi:nucleoside-diphosphate-sugar epimerase